jgi:hypothetical protein
LSGLSGQVSQEELGLMSSSAVTTFTISSKYEKEEFGESLFFFREGGGKVSIKKLFSVARLTPADVHISSSTSPRKGKKMKKIFVKNWKGFFDILTFWPLHYLI